MLTLWSLIVEFWSLTKKKKWGALLGLTLALVGGSVAYASVVYVIDNNRQIEQLTKNQRDIITAMKIMNNTVLDMKTTIITVDDTNRQMIKMVLDLSGAVYKPRGE